MQEEHKQELPQEEALPEHDIQDEEHHEINTLHEEIAQLKELALRERAENENLRKRHERELQQAHKFALERLLKDLIPVLDSLTLGLDAAQKHQENEALNEFVKGSEMTLKVLLDILQRYGVEEINPLGEKLNPEWHQALSVIPQPGVEPNTIIQVAQKGYVLNGRVIRAAQVLVAGQA